MNEKRQCFVDFNKTRRLATIIRTNTHTVWVRIIVGCNTKVYVKRHLRKHNVVMRTNIRPNMLHGTYIGTKYPDLRGEKALLRESAGVLLAQFDNLKLSMSYGWHYFYHEDFLLDGEGDL